ncbi:MAG: LamG-like jellyroll fold domain-containing protein [Gaiellaceae bacterium]
MRRIRLRVVVAISAMLLILLPAQLGSSAPAPRALQLNGTSQYVTFGAAPGLGAAQFTLETWFKRTGAGLGTGTGNGGITSAIPLITKGRAEAETPANLNMNYFLGIDATSGKLVADFEDTSGGTNHPFTGTTVVTNNVWHHAAATFNGTTLTVYLDGVADGSLAVTATPESSSIEHAALGTAMTSTGAAAGFFQGIIDEARIWNVARTQAQIQALKDAEVTSAPSLIGRWGLNEGGGSTVGDSTGSLNNGTTAAAPTWTSDTPTLTAAPAWNSGLYFTGVNPSHTTFGQAPNLGAAQFTLETWFKRTGTGATTTTGALTAVPLVTKGRGEADVGSNVDINYFLGLDGPTGKLAVDFEEGATGASPSANHPLVGNTVVTNNVWHHAAATYDGTTWRLYLDGVADGSLAVGQPPRADSIQHAALGTAMNSTGVAAGFFQGAMDEARIWNVARTQAQIQATKDLELPSATGLVGRWGLNEGGGTSATASAGTANGTVVNGGWVAGAPVSTDATPPAQPQGLAATPGDGSVSLNWTPNSDADLAGYNLYRATTAPVPTTGTAVNGSTLLTSPGYIDTGLTNGTTYHYVVVAVDNVGNASTASAEAVATPAPSGPHALEFNGTSQYVTMGAAPGLGAAQFTLETWFKWTGGGAATSTGTGGITAIPLVTKGRAEAEGSNVDMNYFLGISGGKLAADFEEGAGGAGPLGQNHPVTGATTITTGSWHHAAATYDGTTWKLYLDGVLDAKLAVGQPPRADSIQHAALGTAMTSAGVAAGFFAGDLDEARIWSLARTGAQIRGSRDSAIPTATGLVGRFGMDEGFGTTVGNSAGAPNGTVVGGPTWITGYAFPQDTVAPAAPAGLAATGGDGTASLSWSASAESDLAGYNLYRSTTTPVDTNGSPLNGADLIQGTSYLDGGLANGTTYHYALVAIDGSGGRSAASETTATPQPPPPTAHALEFNGSSQYVTMGAAPGLNAAQFTLETWFKRTGAGAATSTGSGGIANAIPLVTKGRAEAEGSNVDMNYFLGIDATSGRLVADFEEGPGGAGPLGQNHPISGATLVTSNLWHHAAATYDGTTWKLYLDGVLDGTLAVGQPPRADSIQHAALGTALNSTGVAAGFFQGDLDEAHVWNYARTGAQIRAARNSELAAAAGLVGRFGMNEGTGTTVANSAGSPNGAAVGSPNWITGYDFTQDTASPAMPANLSATADDASVALTWDANGESDLAGYDLYRSTTSPVTASGTPLNGADLIQATSYADGGLTNGTTYYYALVAVDSSDNRSAASAEASATPVQGDPVLAGAGDVAICTGTGDEDTADVLETMPSAGVFTIGDNVYENGLLSEFNSCYTPSWGRPGIKSRTRPTIGNHDYGNNSNDGGGYFDYFNGVGNFGGAAGDRDKAYYSYDVGDYWHVVVLNSECYFYTNRCSASAEEAWLRGDLAANASKNVIAMWHRPRWSSGPSRPGIPTLQPLWQTLFDYGVELLLAGHDHHYERFAPQNASGQADNVHGVREIIVGTGGAEFSSLGTTAANSEVRNNVTNGVLKLRLHQSSYDWQFVHATGGTFTDSGTDPVHSAPANTPPTATVSLSSNAPRTNDTLTATATKADADGQPVSLTFVWKVNGVATRSFTSASALTDTFSLGVAGNGDKGDLVSVEVTPNDGVVDGTTAAAQATVANTGPAFSQNLQDRTDDEGAAVSLAAPATDADTDPISYAATGLPAGLSIDASTGLISGTVSSTAATGSPYAASITATDGTATATDTFTWTITHPNQPPTLTSVTIDQSAPKTTDILTVTIAASDPDNDPLTYSYQWAKNGSDLAGRTSATLNLGGTGNGDRGDTITVRVVANDGAASSDPLSSASVTVQNSAPTVSVALDNSTPGTNDTLTATATTADADGDGVAVTYVWKVNGTTKRTTTNSIGSDSFDLSVAGNGDLGDTVSVAATPDDGTATGASNSATATVVGAPAGKGLQFDGTNDYVTFGAAPSLGAATFTLETWFKRTGAGVGTNTGSGGIANAIPLVTKGRAEAEGSNVDMNYFLGIDASSGQLVADFEEGGSGTTPGQNHPVSGGTVVTSNVWHHVAATYDGTTWRLYLDGAADGSLTVGQPPRADSIQHAALGTAMNSTGVAAGSFQGVLDDARVWNYARSQAQIAATKDFEIRAMPGLIGHWPMNAGAGALLADASGGGTDGTLTNGPAWVNGFPTTPDTTAPAAPQSLVATGGDGSVALTWSASTAADLAGYNVYRSTSSPVSTLGPPLNATLLAAPSYNDGAVTNGTTYYYVVRAVDAADNASASSGEASATPQPASHALSFDGTNDYVTFGAAPQLGAATFTLETWFRRTGAGAGTSTGSGGIASAIPLVTKGRAEADGSNLDMNYFLGIDASDGTLVGDFEDTASGANHPVSGQTTVTQNVWHHAAATFDGSYWRLYLDGVLDAKLAVAATPRSDSTQHAALGSALTSTGAAAGFFAGDLDEARIWNVARTGVQIRSARNNALTSGTGLVGRFGMNEGAGTTVGNSAGSPNGTATNGPAWIAGYGFPQDTTAPAAPQSLAASPDDQSATLTWAVGTAVDLAGYDLYRSTSTPVSTSGSPVNGTDLITGTTYVDNGLTNGTAYHYALVAVDSSNNRSATSAEATATPAPGDPLLVGAGDIAKCTSSGDEATADVVETLPNAGVFTIGDNVYENGLASEWTNCYTPSWGRPGIRSRTRPTIGNHDYGNGSNTGGGYFDYFNGVGNFSGPAGDRDKAYYSYDVGLYWHVVVLNSECYFPAIATCSTSAQEQWLQSDLAANTSKNVIAMWHRPRWSSGASRPGVSILQPLWQTLYDYGAELVLAGHDHHYERFAPQNATGQADAAHGVREIIVGTGGAEFTSVGTAVTNSEARNAVTFGVLKLRLHQSSYDWQFLPAAGGTFTDSGTTAVHGMPNVAPVVDSVTIDQASPRTADTLTATITSHDLNGDPVTYARQWTKNGVDIAGATGATLNLATTGNGDKGNQIALRVTASDGVNTSAPLTSSSVLILNSAPTATVSLNNHAPGTNAILTATATRTDADADVVTLTYVWKVNGVIRKTTAGSAALTDTFDLSVAGNGDPGDTITVEVAPTDGTATGASAVDTATVDPAPNVPAGLTVSLSTTAVSLDWANNTETDLAGYNVYRSAAADGPYTNLNAAVLTTSSYADQTAPAQATSYYRVTATDTGGAESSPANTSVFRGIAFRAAASAQTNSANSLAIARPAGTLAGDVLVVAVEVRGAPTITAPSGWTLVRTDTSGTTIRQALYTRVAQATEPASYTWSFSASQAAFGVVSSYAGVNTTAPLDGATGRVNASSTAIATNAFNTTSPSDAIVGFFGTATNASITPPSGMTEQREVAGGNKQKAALESADALQPLAGSTGAPTATASATGVNIGQLVALRPANSPAPTDSEPPTQPTGLAASAFSSTRIDLTWTASTDNVGVVRYDIIRSGTGVVGTSTTTQFSDTGLTPSTSYTYTVQAFDAAGNASPVSSSASATTQAAGGGGSGVTFRAAASASTKSGTTLTIARPTGTQTGDVTLASIDVRNAPTVTAPAGWTLVLSTASTAIGKSTYWHVLGAGEPASYNWTFSSAQVAAGVIVAYSGVDTLTPIDTSSGQASPSGTAIAAPSVTVGAAGSQLVSLVGAAANVTISPPSGMTERSELAGGTGSTKTVSEASDVRAGPGPTGTKSATASRSAPAVAQLVVLRAAP